MKSFASWFDEHEKTFFEEFFTYLRFQSVSADPSRREEVLSCARWVKDFLTKRGFQTQFLEGSGYPAVYGEKIQDPQKPTVLFYGHYDVQPEDPIEEWTSPPFEPEIREGRVYARGAEDNKGQSFYTMKAVEAFLELHPHPPFNIKFLIEGEEEMGSTTLEEIASSHKKLLQADYLMVVDLSMGSMENPSISIGCRGISTMQVDVEMMNRDGHSGEYGGIVYNPIRALCEALAELYDEKGRVAAPGFYDDVKNLSEEEKKELNLSFHPKEYVKDIGVREFFRDEEFTPKEMNAIRPVLEINGIWGGYTQRGFKTVLPKSAHAKISCRLVPRQEPEKIFESVRQFLQEKLPKKAHVQFTYMGGGMAAWASPKSTLSQLVKKSYEQVLGKRVVFEMSGGSIPIISLLSEVSGAQFSLPGTGLPRDAIHAPDENFSLDQIKTGFLIITQFLQNLLEERK